MVKYKILWESLKATADFFAAKEGFNRNGSIYGC